MIPAKLSTNAVLMLNDVLVGVERKAMIEARAQVRAELETAWALKFSEAQKFNEDARACYAKAEALLTDMTAAVELMNEHHAKEDASEAEDESAEAAEEARENAQIASMKAVADALTTAVAKLAETQKQLAAFKPPAPVQIQAPAPVARSGPVIFDVVERDGNGAIKTIAIRP